LKCRTEKAALRQKVKRKPKIGAAKKFYAYYTNAMQKPKE